MSVADDTPNHAGYEEFKLAGSLRSVLWFDRQQGLHSQVATATQSGAHARFRLRVNKGMSFQGIISLTEKRVPSTGASFAPNVLARVHCHVAVEGRFRHLQRGTNVV